MQSLERQIRSFSHKSENWRLIALRHGGRDDPLNKKEDGPDCSKIHFQLIAWQFVNSCLAVIRSLPILSFDRLRVSPTETYQNGLAGIKKHV